MAEKWEWSAFGKCWSHGECKIYQVDGGFCISEDQVWMPGLFASREAAEVAFGVSDDRLSELQGAANERAGGEGGAITSADMAALETCDSCAGTGWGHPDNPAGRCTRCDGLGGMLVE